jgi:hypothetical protein
LRAFVEEDCTQGRQMKWLEEEMERMRWNLINGSFWRLWDL